ncbi:hypothetical protein QTH90_06290 [Variovorax sp. J2P1-59]|uniref:hypothetical protein n=1 Tax=Variovorax flavidus TaxID=3053501 RepID=UPI002577401B|nr:hypothetical protein [Variovorax sp. J2P1-59]MDM0073983.1 hypothetical protein [Variovorax sp. J2P1-59]
MTRIVGMARASRWVPNLSRRGVALVLVGILSSSATCSCNVNFVDLQAVVNGQPNGVDVDKFKAEAYGAIAGSVVFGLAGSAIPAIGTGLGASVGAAVGAFCGCIVQEAGK